MNHEELTGKFRGEDFVKLFYYLNELNLGRWAVGLFWGHESNPYVVMYCLDYGNVVITEIEPPDEPWDDELAMISDGSDVLNVMGFVVDSNANMNEVMRRAMDFVYDGNKCAKYGA